MTETVARKASPDECIFWHGHALSGILRPISSWEIGEAVKQMCQTQEKWWSFSWASTYGCLWKIDQCVQWLATVASSFLVFTAWDFEPVAISYRAKLTLLISFYLSEDASLYLDSLWNNMWLINVLRSICSGNGSLRQHHLIPSPLFICLPVLSSFSSQLLSRVLKLLGSWKEAISFVHRQIRGFDEFDTMPL